MFLSKAEIDILNCEEVVADLFRVVRLGLPSGKSVFNNGFELSYMTLDKLRYNWSLFFSINPPTE
jgi:hypothetical protein